MAGRAIARPAILHLALAKAILNRNGSGVLSASLPTASVTFPMFPCSRQTEPFGINHSPSAIQIRAPMELRARAILENGRAPAMAAPHFLRRSWRGFRLLLTK